MALLVTRIFFVFLLLQLVLPRQYNYKIKHNEIKIDYYNPKYLENPIVNLFYYNKTRQCVNGSVTVLQDLGDKIRINASFYKMVKGKWHAFPLPPTFDFYKNPCVALRTNVLDVQKYTAEYAGITDCPLPKGFYEAYNLYIDDADLPPHGVPFGKYKASGNVYEVDTPDGNIVSGEYLADIVSLKGRH